MYLTQLKFTEPTIVTTNELSHRSYVSFVLNGKPTRQYHGKSVNQPINPNRAKSLSEKSHLLNKLRYEIHKALEAGTYGEKLSSQTNLVHKSYSTATNVEPTVTEQTAIKLLYSAIKLKLRSDLNRKYKRNLKVIYRQFRMFMSQGRAE